MELIKVRVMTNKYGGSIKCPADLQEGFESYFASETIYLNKDQIQYKTEVKECRDHYSNKFLGKYFMVHCINGENYHLKEDQFDMI